LRIGIYLLGAVPASALPNGRGSATINLAYNKIARRN
jgi:hypothetical protein